MSENQSLPDPAVEVPDTDEGIVPESSHDTAEAHEGMLAFLQKRPPEWALPATE